MPVTAIDEVDRQLVERLRAEGRESNRSLAQALGINEATVASRLKRLESGRMMRVVALTDIEAFGFDFLGFGLIRVRGRPALDVAADLAAISEAIAVLVVTGRYDVIVSVLARDRDHLAQLFGETIPAVEGVAALRCELALDVLRFDSKWAVLSAGDGPADGALAPDNVDELDRAIIDSLQRDARVSNRRIAAELGVSEGTVRARIRRMESEGEIRIQAISDVATFGLGANAVVGIEVAGAGADAVGQALLKFPGALIVGRSIGEFGFLVVLGAPSREELLTTILDGIARIPGVRATETFEIAATLKHVYTWALLV